jgi:hypothetical protein
LSFGETRTQLCIPSPTRIVTVGHRLMENSSDAPATVTDVELVDAEGIDLLGAYLVPVRSEGVSMIGMDDTFPPRDPLPATWADRQEAIGGEIAGGETMGVAVGLRARMDLAQVGAIRFSYESRGSQHTVTYWTSIKITDQPSCPKTGGR